LTSLWQDRSPTLSPPPVPRVWGSSVKRPAIARATALVIVGFGLGSMAARLLPSLPMWTGSTAAAIGPTSVAAGVSAAQNLPMPQNNELVLRIRVEAASSASPGTPKAADERAPAERESPRATATVERR
jgi:hypothetical protein